MQLPIMGISADRSHFMSLSSFIPNEVRIQSLNALHMNRPRKPFAPVIRTLCLLIVSIAVMILGCKDTVLVVKNGSL